MAKVEIEKTDENKFPCFGINKFSDGIVIVEFSSQCKGCVILDTRKEPEFVSGHYAENWKILENWDIVTKEFTLKFTV